jgi:hypothetical protein
MIHTNDTEYNTVMSCDAPFNPCQLSIKTVIWYFYKFHVRDSAKRSSGGKNGELISWNNPHSYELFTEVGKIIIQHHRYTVMLDCDLTWSINVKDLGITCVCVYLSHFNSRVDWPKSKDAYAFDLVLWIIDQWPFNSWQSDTTDFKPSTIDPRMGEKRALCN